MTNYLDCFENIVSVFNEWFRVLKPDGIVVGMCMNAAAYTNPSGPLENRRRVQCFTETTLRCYFSGCKFSVKSIEKVDKFLYFIAYPNKK